MGPGNYLFWSFFFVDEESEKPKSWALEDARTKDGRGLQIEVERIKSCTSILKMFFLLSVKIAPISDLWLPRSGIAHRGGAV